MPSPPRRALPLWLIGFAVVAALVLGAGAWHGVRLDLLAGTPIAAGEMPVAVTVGGETLTTPANRLRFADQRRAGSYPRVELELKWPGMRALDSDDPALMTTARDSQLVFISIEPRDTDLDTADRIGTIYQKFLAATDSPDPKAPPPAGLIRRNFLAGTAYDGEELYFEPGSVHPFAARCFPPDKGQPPISCLRDVRLGKHLLATTRFPITALNDWRALRDRTDAILQEMTGGSSG